MGIKNQINWSRGRLGGYILTIDNNMRQTFAYVVLTFSKDSLHPHRSAGEHCTHVCHHCDRIPTIGNLKLRSVCSDLWLQNLQSIVAWLCCFGPVVASCTMVGHGRQVAHLMTTMKNREGEAGKTSKTYHQLPIIVLLSPTSLGPHHLSEAPCAEDCAINT